MSVRDWRASVPTAAPRWLPWIALVLVALLCVWLAVRLLWSLLTDVAVNTGNTTPVASQPAAPSLDVAHWHLFGNGNHTRLQEQILQARRETELKLTLHGTFAESDPHDGYALIADEHGVEAGYHVGETLPDGVKLNAVYADHVVLDNHGRAENLSLPRDTLHSIPVDQAVGATAAGTPMAGGDATSKAATPMFVAPRMVYGKIDWQAARKQVRENPQALLQQLDPEPVFNGTHMRGVRLGAGADSPLLAKAGLQAGDVITAVNGTPLDSPARGEQLMQQLGNASSVEVTLLRNGQPQTVTVDLGDQ